MKRIIVILLIALFPLVIYGQEVIEKIEVIGNERVTEDMILYYLTFDEGDYFDKTAIQEGFKALWDRGYFSDIEIKTEDGQNGKIVKVYVEEYPVIKKITYKTGKKIKEKDIEEKLSEENASIGLYSYYRPYHVNKVKKTIEQMMEEKGLTSGKVDAEVKNRKSNEVEIIFDIREGRKIKIGDVEFEGKPKLRESTLMNALSENKEHSFISWASGKDTYKPEQLQADVANLVEKFKEHGFMEAQVGEPEIKEIEKRSIFFKKQTMKKISIPVDAGYLYFVGDVAIEGNEIFNAQNLRTMIPLKKGEVYSIEDREKGVEEISKLYQNFGYMYIRVIPVERLDPKNKRVNVTYNIAEGPMAYIHRVEFRGNTYTNDKVMRREMMIREGNPFSYELFKNSVLRINQLGLVEIKEDPDIQPDPQDPSQVDVTVNVTELQRNNIQFTAGYSGYQGAFVSASYSTVNFLGAGEKLELVAMYGKRIKNYSFGFTEPYIFDLPMNAGFSIHNQEMIYPGLFNRKGKGIDLHVGGRIKGYWRARLSYGLENLDISEYEGDEDFIPFYNPYSPYGGGYGGGFGGGYNPYYGAGFGYGKYNISSISPMIYRNTVDSPLTPSRGTLYMVNCKFAGGILGGDISMIKPRFEWTLYKPLIKNTSLGFHIEYKFIKTIQDSDIPFWERFYLGGERSIRGYDIYTIGPRNQEGVNLGGQKALIFNAEYIIPVGGPVYAIFFYDMGNAYAPDQKVNISDMYTSAGLEARIFVPALRVPFRLIFSYNNRIARQGDSNFKFRFAIGTTF
ncbi:MAG: outer membrane protein assembly factor BamA [Candidatus Aminicenantes bacterium]|nr:outer membrane protein assembly factor BamA [Candidatus Aminicenantes bacterium]